ncbi:MAG: hypothetical protein ACOC28_04735 [Alkalispirochaetaceae bacterium]
MNRYRYLALAAVVLLLSSCTRGSVGIFASIEQEVKTQKSNLSESSAITGVVESSNHIYASIGNIASRTKNGTEWNGVGDPPGIDSPISVALVQIGDPNSGSREYYAAFNSQEGDEYGLFQLSIDESSGAVTFTERNIAYDGNDVSEIAALIPVDSDHDGFADLLYASLRTGFENQEPLFTLVANPAGIGGTEEVLRDNSADNLFDAAVDNDSDTWFVGSKGAVYRLTGSTLTQLAGSDAAYPTDSEGTKGKSFSGAYAADLGDLGGTGGTVALFLSDTDGRIWVTTDSGGSWEMTDLSGRAFSDMIWLPRAGDGGDGALLVGTKPFIQRAVDDQGLFEVELTVSGTSVTIDSLAAPDTSSYNTSELQSATVSSFYRPDDGTAPSIAPDSNDLFVLTGGLGLWALTYGSDGIPEEVRWE